MTARRLALILAFVLLPTAVYAQTAPVVYPPIFTPPAACSAGQALSWNGTALSCVTAGGDVTTDAVWDAAGDLIVGTGANTAARLAKGAALQVLRVNAGATALEWAALAGGGDALVGDPLSQFAATTLAQLCGVLSDEGTGVCTALAVNVGSAGAFVTFNGAGGTPSSLTGTNITGAPISTAVSGLGTNVATALGVNVGSAGAVVTFNGALGTPSSGTGTNITGIPTAGLLDAAVTLAKMANLAQDQFIGRTTASTGVPETATITAAARTVLDDTTVGAMVDTLGGASSSGTGGLARVASPSFTTPALDTPSALVLTNATALPLAAIANDLITLAKIADCAAGTVLSNITGGAANVICNTYTDLATAMGIVSVTDPGGHRLFGWDDTDGAFQAFVIGAGLTYTQATDTLTADLGTAITSSEITDGEIVNGDINASAAIALSKLAAQAANTFTMNNTGSSAVPTAVTAADVWALTKTLTGTTYDVEGTGNVFTDVGAYAFSVGVVQGTTASLGLSCKTALCPTATDLTGTNVPRAWASFPDSDGEFELVGEIPLRPDFIGVMDVRGKWRAAATSGDIVLQVQWACTADEETFNDTWSTASTTTETAKGTTLQLNDWAVTSITIAGCAASENASVRVMRQRTHASDSLTGVFFLGPFNVMLRAAK